MTARLTQLQHVVPEVPRLHLQDSGASAVGRRAEVVIHTTDDRLETVAAQVAHSFNNSTATVTALDEIVEAAAREDVLSREELRRRLAEVRNTAQETLEILGVIGSQK